MPTEDLAFISPYIKLMTDDTTVISGRTAGLSQYYQGR
jgi:hypothetical protein